MTSDARIYKPAWSISHTHYTRVLTIEKPSKLIYIAGQTPADDKYQPVHPGDLRAQYIAVLDGLTLQLKAAGATWDHVVFRRMYAVDVPAFVKVMNDSTCCYRGTKGGLLPAR